MYYGNTEMMMIASSSSYSQFQGRRKQLGLDDDDVEYLNQSYLSSNQSLYQERGAPLAGIKSDIQNFKRKYKQPSVIETSSDKSMLLHRDYILNWLYHSFLNQRKKYFFLFYSGHGHTNGDLAVETQEKPSADRISIEQVIQIWQEVNRDRDEDSYLYIFMDSCNSGEWCRALKQIYRYSKINISVFASCRSGPSWQDISRQGGLFFNCINSKTQFEASYNKLAKKQTPIFTTKDHQIRTLTITMLQGLRNKIGNAADIVAGTFRPTGPGFGIDRPTIVHVPVSYVPIRIIQTNNREQNKNTEYFGKLGNNIMNNNVGYQYENKNGNQYGKVEAGSQAPESKNYINNKLHLNVDYPSHHQRELFTKISNNNNNGYNYNQKKEQNYNNNLNHNSNNYNYKNNSHLSISDVSNNKSKNNYKPDNPEQDSLDRLGYFYPKNNNRKGFMAGIGKYS